MGEALGSGGMQKNFLSICLDDMVAYRTARSLFGDVLHTPNIDRLMAMGTSFDNAFAQIPMCSPSRISILTGQRPVTTGVIDNNVAWRDYVDPAHTLPAVLSAAGYETGIYGKVFHNYQEPHAGFPGYENVKVSVDRTAWNKMDLNPFTRGPLTTPEETHGDYVNTSDAIAAIEGWDGGAPFAVFLGISKPHMDFTAPQRFFDLFPVERIEGARVDARDRDDLPDYALAMVSSAYGDFLNQSDDTELTIQAYLAALAFADDQVGRVLDTLEREGRMDDTAIVLWSDHGYHFGDKGVWGKTTLWDEATRAPLVFYDPDGGPADRVVTYPVELVDIAATVYELLDVAPPHRVEGTSLVPEVRGTGTLSDGLAFSSVYGSVSMRTPGWRYIRYQNGEEELYDVAADPYQWDNLAANPTFDGIRTSLRERALGSLHDFGWRFVEEDVDLSGADRNLAVVIGNPEAEVIGGPGRDMYFPEPGAGRIVEAPDGGHDTVYPRASFDLPPNVEDAQLAIFMKADVNAEFVGNDMPNVLASAARLIGGAGDDTLRILASEMGYAAGGEGHDYIGGSTRPDRIEGGPGNDTITGGGGDDTVLPGGGEDRVFGGPGVDIVSYRGLAGPVTIDLNEGTMILNGVVAKLAGFEGMVGSSGADLLVGTGKAETIEPGPGADTIEGGGGGDTLLFGPGHGVNLVRQFVPGEDRIGLSGEGTTYALTHDDGANASTLRYEGTTLVVEDARLGENDITFLDLISN